MISRPSRSLSLSLARKRVLLVGLGLHGGGVGTAKWLLSQRARLRITDRKSAAELAPSLRQLPSKSITYHLGGHTPADFRWADIIVLNPDVNPESDEMKRLIPRGARVENELTLFLPRCPAMTIGITGTRGKTTTTLLITHILKTAGRKAVASGNVRQDPMLAVLPKLKANHVAVLELSSFQLQLLPQIARSPHIAVMTNLSVDHLSRHGTMAVYQQTKAHLFYYQQADDVAILNADNVWTQKIAAHVPGQLRRFTSSKTSAQCQYGVESGWVVERVGPNKKRTVSLAQFSLSGAHQVENLLAAVAATRAAGVTVADIARGVRSFRGVAHRQEQVRTWKGHTFINDTTATSPEGALAALRVFPSALFIVGGTDKQLDFRLMAQHLVRHRISVVFLPGTATKRLCAAMRRAGWKNQLRVTSSMAEAVRTAVQLAKPKQAIVLSPGAASFGLFFHEFDRGEHFIREVKKLGTV